MKQISQKPPIKIVPLPLRPLCRRQVFSSPGQILRTAMLFCIFCLAFALAAANNPAKAEDAGHNDAAFDNFVAALWPDAQRMGVSRATFDAAFQGVNPDPSLLKHSGKQAEFVKPIWQYLSATVSPARVARGREREAEFADTLARIEARYGVDRFVILAVWGMETNYGAYSGKSSIVRSLATLAEAKYRGTFFRDELLVALKILEERHISPEGMLGSWAGAMGQTQFMPSSFMKYAVDWDGDGHKDIWTSVPDALASTAYYLAEHGWIKGWTWGYEVVLPSNLSLKAFEPHEFRPFTQWTAAGLVRTDGESMPRIGEAALMLPAGRSGPAILVTRNFQAIKSYNASTAYALGVAFLSDRLAGAPALRTPWPVHERTLDTNQSVEMQKHLIRLGYRIGDLDGKIGEKAQVAIRHYQRQAGLEPDGFASVPLLEKMRKRP
ncbi:MAG: lytic transglycosylase [Hyphomicrobiales bacterium]|nr:lytic transglycosylase [Hyphomicrobiales bacterium]